MNLKKALPTGDMLAREVIIVIGGAVIAAAIIGQIPSVRDWIKKQWDGAPKL